MHDPCTSERGGIFKVQEIVKMKLWSEAARLGQVHRQSGGRIQISCSPFLCIFAISHFHFLAYPLSHCAREPKSESSKERRRERKKGTGHRAFLAFSPALARACKLCCKMGERESTAGQGHSLMLFDTSGPTPREERGTILKSCPHALARQRSIVPGWPQSQKNTPHAQTRAGAHAA